MCQELWPRYRLSLHARRVGERQPKTMQRLVLLTRTPRPRPSRMCRCCCCQRGPAGKIHALASGEQKWPIEGTC
jgi:hypothetical protein